MDVKVLKAIGTKKEGEYKLYLPDIERSLTIWFSNEFPFIIEGWEEKYARKGDSYTSTAQRIHTKRRQYWQENNSTFERLRTPFKLH